MLTIEEINKIINSLKHFEKECFILDQDIYDKIDNDHKPIVSNQDYKIKQLFWLEIYLNEYNDFEEWLYLSYQLFKKNKYDRIYYVRKDCIYDLWKEISWLFELKYPDYSLIK